MGSERHAALARTLVRSRQRLATLLIPSQDEHWVRRLDSLLPQTQCGQCGHPGCRPYAKALVEGAAHNLCPPGGEETQQALARLLRRPPLPFPHPDPPPDQVAWIREDDCVGCTKCIQACPVDAILGTARRMHTVIESECTGCGLCLPPCPVDCIDLLPRPQPVHRPAHPALATRRQRQRRAALARRRFEAREQRLQAQQALRRQRQALRLAQVRSTEPSPAEPPPLTPRNPSPGSSSADAPAPSASIAVMAPPPSASDRHALLIQRRNALKQAERLHRAARQALEQHRKRFPDRDPTAAEARVATLQQRLDAARAALTQAEAAPISPRNPVRLRNTLRQAQALHRSAEQALTQRQRRAPEQDHTEAETRVAQLQQRAESARQALAQAEAQRGRDDAPPSAPLLGATPTAMATDTATLARLRNALKQAEKLHRDARQALAHLLRHQPQADATGARSRVEALAQRLQQARAALDAALGADSSGER